VSGSGWMMVASASKALDSMNGLARGALGGLAATGAMSIPMLLGSRLGGMSKQPPERITEDALDVADVDLHSESTEHALATLAHFAFGAGAGALFGVLHDRFEPPGSPIIHGLGFGLIVWATSYLGWIPMLGILPAAPNDEPGRRRIMFLSHLLYGAVLGSVVGRGRARTACGSASCSAGAAWSASRITPERSRRSSTT
jgi:hypothetical protein